MYYYSKYWTSNFQIEREKADLSVQVIQLSERLEEAEGGAESQVRYQFGYVFLEIQPNFIISVRK